MSRIVNPATSPSRPPANDPYYIGWRERTRVLPDGRLDLERIPLTLEDALHPQEDDKIVESTIHDRNRRYLQDVFEQRLAGDPSALVLGDCKVLWEDGVHHSPDVAVIFGVRDRQSNYSQFDVAAEGARPRLIIEVVSPNTRPNDIDTKFQQYHHYRVPTYVIVDRASEDEPYQLLGYERTQRRYRPLEREGDGRLWLEPMNLYLGVRDNRVVAYDGDTGEELGDYVAVTAALVAEQERATAAEARADAERQRADAERQRADAERQRTADAEARAAGAEARAAANRQRADVERQRAEAAEVRLRQLEAELLRRQTPPASQEP